MNTQEKREAIKSKVKDSLHYEVLEVEGVTALDILRAADELLTTWHGDSYYTFGTRFVLTASGYLYMIDIQLI